VKLLLDTHIIFWWTTEPSKLSRSAKAAIRNRTSTVAVSVASFWEMAIKIGVGKWPEAAALVATLEIDMAIEGFSILPISVDNVRTAGLMRAAHQDPLDRLLAAQAQTENLTLVSADPKLAGLGAAILA
jgi:PIN domain nuclease of toxin-antitoxin system